METTEILVPAEKAPVDDNAVRQAILQDLLDRVVRQSKEPRKPEKKMEQAKKKYEWDTRSYLKSFYANDKGEKLQNSGMTRGSRFPKIMASAKELMPNAKRIMSFGCSTGNEVQDLLATFPDAELIVGVDIDHNSIQHARRNNKSDKVFYTDEINLLGAFDVITMLQVAFCLEFEIPKERWLKVMKKVEPHVAPGGIICVYTSDHPLEEVFAADKYEPLNVWVRKHNRKPDGKDYYNGYFRRRRAGEHEQTTS
jgi:2-polyprenyl-3-methyl-5-hydroxy-6-metoxy-1,4-benzoquinol methylase